MKGKDGGRPRGDRQHGGGHRLAHPTPHLYHSTERNARTGYRRSSSHQLFPWSPLKGPSDPRHCLFLLISASAHLDGVQQGLQTDTYNAKEFTLVLGIPSECVGATTTERLGSTWTNVRSKWTHTHPRGDSSPSPVQERGQKGKQIQWLRSGASEELEGNQMVAWERS